MAFRGSLRHVRCQGWQGQAIEVEINVLRTESRREYVKYAWLYRETQRLG